MAYSEHGAPLLQANRIGKAQWCGGEGGEKSSTSSSGHDEILGVFKVNKILLGTKKMRNRSMYVFMSQCDNDLNL